jgi:RNA polymerase sigma-70 factor (ECF subfamily)
MNEIIQEVFLKLCEDERRILREFEDRGNDSFLKLLRVVTASIATDYFRRIRAEKRGGQMSIVPLDADMPQENKTSTVDSSTVELPTLIAQLDRLILRNPAKISPRDRALFWLYYRHGLTSEAISRIPAIGLSAKGVESALSRISRTLRHAIVNGKRLPEPPKQFQTEIADGKGFSRVVAIDSIKNRC